MKQKVRQYFNRGRVEVFIHVSGEGVKTKTVQVNWNVLDQYLNALDEIKSKRSISGDLEFEDILQLEGIFLEDEEANVDEFLQEKEIGRASCRERV